jgi:hypothetical protein
MGDVASEEFADVFDEKRGHEISCVATRVPGAVQRETMRCRPGTQRSSSSWTPDLRCTTSLALVLHRVRGTAVPTLRRRLHLPNYSRQGANTFMDRAAEQLKFAVLDEEDLEVVSTHLQDAVVKVADVLWRPKENRLVVALNRFDWERAQGSRPEYCRRRTALRFERVMSCKCQGLDPAQKDAVLNLLAVEFTETDTPAGEVTLIFSGGGTLRLAVECLEAELADLGPTWTCSGRPIHAVENKD